MSEDSATPKELMRQLGEQLRSDPSRTDGIDAIYAFDITGPAGGSWWVEAQNGSGDVHEGATENAVTTVTMSDEIFVKVATKRLDGGEAFFNGQLTVGGDQGKAIFLAQIFGD